MHQNLKFLIKPFELKLIQCFLLKAKVISYMKNGEKIAIWKPYGRK